MKAVIGLLILFSFAAVAGEFENRVNAAEAAAEVASSAKAEARRAQSHVKFQQIISGVVARRFGGFRDGVPQVSGHSHDGGALLMGELMGTSEFTTKTNLVCHAWGNAGCRYIDNRCYFSSTKVECVDTHGKITDSGWLNRSW